MYRFLNVILWVAIIVGDLIAFSVGHSTTNNGTLILCVLGGAAINVLALVALQVIYVYYSDQ